MKRTIALFLLVILLAAVFAACGAKAQEEKPIETPSSETEATQAPTEEPVQEPTQESASEEPEGKIDLPDGVYTAEFKTDSSMFHVNEANKGLGILTVKDGKATIHVSLASKSILNLFFGTAEDAQKDGAELLEPTTDTVTYDDGMSEEVYGFDIPVPYLDKEFDCALVGTKGKWYDHKVSVSDPVLKIEDGEYTCAVTLEGGTGRASIQSPAKIVVKDGVITATVVWSSSHYELMTVNGVEYKPVTTDGGSTFEIPAVLDADMNVSALTTAMSEPHTIEYVLHFDGSTLEKAN